MENLKPVVKPFTSWEKHLQCLVFMHLDATCRPDCLYVGFICGPGIVDGFRAIETHLFRLCKLIWTIRELHKNERSRSHKKSKGGQIENAFFWRCPFSLIQNLPEPVKESRKRKPMGSREFLSPGSYDNPCIKWELLFTYIGKIKRHVTQRAVQNKTQLPLP